MGENNTRLRIVENCHDLAKTAPVEVRVWATRKGTRL